MNKKILVALLAMSLTTSMALGAVAASEASTSSDASTSSTSSAADASTSSAADTSTSTSSTDASASTSSTDVSTSSAASDASTSSAASTSVAASTSSAAAATETSTTSTKATTAVVGTPTATSASVLAEATTIVSTTASSAATVSKTDTAINYVTVAAVNNAIKAATNEGNKNAIANIVFRNPNEFGRKNLLNIKKTAVTTAEGSAIKVAPVVCADTVANGKVSARMYIDPMKINNNSVENLKTAIQTGNNKICLDVQAHFNKYFSNKNLEVVRFDHQGDFAMDMDTSVNVNLENFDTSTLHFYNFNWSTNEFTEFTETAKGFVDANGYLHFTTDMGRYVIVTDSPIAK